MMFRFEKWHSKYFENTKKNVTFSVVSLVMNHKVNSFRIIWLDIELQMK